MGSAFEFLNENNHKKAVLLFHGLTGSPFEMKKFGKFLSINGYDVYGGCLPGHGEYKSDIYTVSYNDWIKYAENLFEKLNQKYEEVYVGGLCLGAVVSLYLCEKYQEKVKGAILLSTTLYLDGWRLPWYACFMPFGLNTIFRYYYQYPECEPYGVKNKRIREIVKKALKTDGGMDTYPMCAFHELLELSQDVRYDLDMVTSPLLIIHSREDDLASKKGAEEVYKEVSSKEKELIILEDSYHMVLYDNEKDYVFNKSLDFLNKHSKNEQAEEVMAV